MKEPGELSVADNSGEKLKLPPQPDIPFRIGGGAMQVLATVIVAWALLAFFAALYFGGWFEHG